MIRHSPAADRNRDPILEQLARRLPKTGTVLEIASGTGQHVAWFARALPGLRWQPSDIDASLFDSVRAYVAETGADNVADPVELDVTSTPWPVASVDAVYSANMIHIAPWAAAQGLLAGAGDALEAGGMLHIYGPFRRQGNHTAPSNAAFDESLKARDPAWGIRDLEAVTELADAAGFDAPEVVEMPANNLFVTFIRR